MTMTSHSTSTCPCDKQPPYLHLSHEGRWVKFSGAGRRTCRDGDVQTVILGCHTSPAGIRPMFSLDDRPYTLCDRISRRELMRIGGLNLLGLSLPTLLGGPGPRQRRPAQFRSDLWPGQERHLPLAAGRTAPARDVRPQARRAGRNPRAVQPISTNVPGIQFCELLPRTAAIADKLAVVRSMSTDDNTHDTSGYWVLTGNKYPGGSAREIKPSDWPYFGSVVKMLKPSERVPALSSVWIPDIMRLNDNVRPAGQTGGFLGPSGIPIGSSATLRPTNYRVEGLTLPDGISPLRLEGRVSLVRASGPASGSQLTNIERPARAATSTTSARRPLACSPPARRARRFTFAASPSTSASVTARIAGDSACYWLADWSRPACGWSTSAGRASRAIRPSTTRCGTPTPKMPTGCRTRCARCSTWAIRR